jgi:hypothetical protein
MKSPGSVLLHCTMVLALTASCPRRGIWPRGFFKANTDGGNRKAQRYTPLRRLSQFRRCVISVGILRGPARVQRARALAVALHKSRPIPWFNRPQPLWLLEFDITIAHATRRRVQCKSVRTRCRQSQWACDCSSADHFMLTQIRPIAGVGKRIGQALSHGLKRAGHHLLDKTSNSQSAADRSGWRNAGRQERRRRADWLGRSDGARPYAQGRRNRQFWPFTNPVSSAHPVTLGRRNGADLAITITSGRIHRHSRNTCLARRGSGGELRALTRQCGMNFLLALRKAYRELEAIAARGIHRSMKRIAALRVVCLMRRRTHAPEDPDLVLMRNAEFQIMLSELRYPPIHYL